MRRIATMCLKGGSSKTTTTTALAVGLAGLGHRILCLDADPQGNASWTLLGGQGAEGATLADVLMRRADVEDAILPTRVEGLDLLPADATLGGVNVSLTQELGRDTRLRSTLARLEGRYDYVLADTGPQLSTVLANVMVWADEVIAPVDPGVYAILGLRELMDTLAEVREAYGATVHLAGLVVTRTQRTSVARDVEAELRARFGDLVFKATVPLSSLVEAAHTRGLTIMEHARLSPAALAYERLVTEVVDHGRAKERGGVQAGRGPGAIDAA